MLAQQLVLRPGEARPMMH
ncbi:hypothetical protein A2U01_0110432, partial [Trifolium medium]|nr:hypothetical protein [Trifolium medium]